MDRLLSVEADLTATVDGQEVRVEGYGDRVIVSFPTFAAARRARETVDELPVPFDSLDAAAEAGIDVDVRIRGASVARLGPGVRAGPLSRLVGAAPARVSVVGALRALR
ncbi:MAG: hypothetical protein ABEJ43_01175 [Haloferacaceae archaeon]